MKHTWLLFRCAYHNEKAKRLAAKAVNEVLKAESRMAALEAYENGR